MKTQVYNFANAVSLSLLIVCFIILFFSFAHLANASILNSTSRPSTRIVGGRNATEGQFPYQVSLQVELEHWCGGSIISARYVVTAAHCVTTSTGKTMPASKFSIRAGSNQVNSDGVVSTIAQIVRHPRFLSSKNDIALLRLSTELIFSDRIQAIPLATAEPPAGAAVIIAGWGRLRADGAIPIQLQYNTVSVISRAQCKRQIGFVSPTIICLAHTTGNGACYGDSGGPAVYNGRLVGVANYFIRQCGSNLPDGYANVYTLRKWLTQNSDVE